ncbi:MAG: hypothetical protein HFI35_09750 [Roseburia sp.]|nr:hypothetical protein [Roseburia sp.]
MHICRLKRRPGRCIVTQSTGFGGIHVRRAAIRLAAGTVIQGNVIRLFPGSVIQGSVIRGAVVRRGAGSVIRSCVSAGCTGVLTGIRRSASAGCEQESDCDT